MEEIGEREVIQMGARMRFRARPGSIQVNILHLASHFHQLETGEGDAFLLAEELSCAVSRRVLHVPVTARERSSGSQHHANW